MAGGHENGAPRNLHRLAEQRSLALHTEVARRLREEPALLNAVRARLSALPRSRSESYVAEWKYILDQPLDAILEVLVDDSEHARALRQATPFAGVVDARTRWKIWREVRQRFEASNEAR